MSKEKKDALVTQGSDLPDFLREQTSVEGTEDITADDLKMPRLAIAQGLSPQINRSKPEFIDKLQLGQLFNTLEKTNYGEGPLKFWIVRRNRPRHMEFRDFDDGGGIEDFDVPANDPRTKFGADGSPPVATKFYDYIICLESGELLAMSCKGTSLKAAMHLNGLIKNSRRAVYARNYVVSTAPDSNDKGDYFIFQFDLAGWVGSEEEYNDRKALFDQTKEVKVAPESFDMGPSEATVEEVSTTEEEF